MAISSAAVRRLLDLGAEPVSLASALTLGVGQRVVRTNCPNCSVEERSPLADLIPGRRAGHGDAPRHRMSQLRQDRASPGATGVFEVLPFTEPVRAVIARSGSRSEIETMRREPQGCGR